MTANWCIWCGTETHRSCDCSAAQLQASLATANEIIKQLIEQVTQQAATISQLQDLVRTMWSVGTFGMSAGNALSEDGRLKAALANVHTEEPAK